MLAEKVEKLQIKLNRKLNDSHIFIEQSIPLLKLAKNNKKSNETKSRKYYVPPSNTQITEVYRTDKQLKEIYNRFVTREIFENFIIIAVSQCESYIFEVLKAIMQIYPQKLVIPISKEKTASDKEQEKKISLDIIIGSTNIESIWETLIDKKLHEVSFVKPKDYLIFKSITGVDTTKDVFNDYIEIKATRDLLVHNSGIINSIYLEKVGDIKRGEVGHKIPINSDYFYKCVSTIKTASQIIKEEIIENFPNN